MAKKSKSGLPALPKPPSPRASVKTWEKYAEKKRKIVTLRNRLKAIGASIVRAVRRKRR